jgi:SAM-dependent MidA family methyltransferase
MEHSPPVAPVSAAFARRFRGRAKATPAALSFADFMDLALYDDEVGYYRAPRDRVGRGRGTDFYTAASMDEAFGPLVAAAAATLTGEDAAGAYDFVELGAEPGRSVLAGVTHPFRSTRALRVGEPLHVDGAAIVFSNELFDAQPFHRLGYRAGAWRERGVALEDDRLQWIELPALSAELGELAALLPRNPAEGYVLDVPWRAARLAATLLARPWHGVFLALDYGRTWAQLTTEYPAGTGRGYVAHGQTGDLLATPGAQDLTCHVCWDWLEDALQQSDFTAITRESQEAFFLRRATAEVERLVALDRNPLSRRRSQLKQLLHPGLMGQKFEALWARRESGDERRQPH